jgi:hypothetical protein
MRTGARFDGDRDEPVRQRHEVVVGGVSKEVELAEPCRASSML